MKLTVLKFNGGAEGSIEVRDDIFSARLKEQAIAQVYRAQNALRHQISANTLRKGEVSGGGKKPWRQKGTGRARAGSNRSPVWRGGGITFGPSNEKNLLLSIPAKMRQKAVRALLTKTYKNNALFVIESSDKAGRRDYLWLYDLAKIDTKKILFISDPVETAAIRANRNLYNVHTIGNNSINLADLINTDVVVFTTGGMAVYGKNKAAAPQKPAVKQMKDKV